jgi:hypothetical protein
VTASGIRVSAQYDAAALQLIALRISHSCARGICCDFTKEVDTLSNVGHSSDDNARATSEVVLNLDVVAFLVQQS